MPLSLKENLPDGSTLCIWTITETEEELKSRFDELGLELNEHDTVESYRIARKRMQWYASRLLSAECIDDFQGIYYDQFGAPHLVESDICVSYSHSYEKIALLYHSDNEVGVDIQRRDEKLKRIADKFLNSDEKKRYEANGRELEELHILWGTKEAVFKVHKHHLPFKKIKTTPFQLKKKGQLEADAHRFDGNHHHVLNFRLMDDYILITTCYDEA
jgi:phosphopantetheinyl transferase